jgi:hypothetical protein
VLPRWAFGQSVLDLVFGTISRLRSMAMAKGQLHSTGTICKAEIRCPIEDKGGQHFNSQEELIAHTVNRTGANPAELQDSLRSGVHLQEVVLMAKEGVFGSSIPDSQTSVPRWPAKVEIDLSGTDEGFRKLYLEHLRRVAPVSSVKDDHGHMSFTVDAIDDPDEYSVQMWAASAAETAGREAGFDEDEIEAIDELYISAELGEKSRSDAVVVQTPGTVELDLRDKSEAFRESFKKSFIANSGYKVAQVKDEEGGRVSFVVETENTTSDEGDLKDAAIDAAVSTVVEHYDDPEEQERLASELKPTADISYEEIIV